MARPGAGSLPAGAARGRLRAILAMAAVASLAGCVLVTHPAATASGCVAYERSVASLALFRGCATQLSEHWAVMAKHEWALTPAGSIVDPDYDLVFVPRDGVPPRWANARRGERVIAYGNPLVSPAPAMTRPGKILAIDTWRGSIDAKPFLAVYYSGPIRVGYSGGPIVNADGAVVGLTVEVLLAPPWTNRTGAVLSAGDGIALPASTVRTEFARLVARQDRLAGLPR